MDPHIVLGQVRRQQSPRDAANAIHLGPGCDQLADDLDLVVVGRLEHHPFVDPQLFHLIAHRQDVIFKQRVAVDLGLELSARGAAASHHT